MQNEQQTQHARAQGLFNAGNTREALSVYLALCKKYSKDIQAWHMAGALAGMTGDYALARTCCETVITLAPNEYAPYQNLASILMATGETTEAMTCFRQSLQLKPDNPQCLSNFAELLRQQGLPAEAEQQLQLAIRHNPAFPQAYNNLGNVYRDTAQPGKAEACYRKAIELQPDYVDALCNLGAALNDQLQFDAAERCYLRAIEYAPDSAAALRNLGNLYQSTGEFEKAERLYEKSLRYAPSDVPTLASLAALHERCGNKTRAAELLEPLIQSQQHDARSAITYAGLLGKRGELKQGIQLLSDTLTACKSQNDSIDLHFALGELFELSGQYSTAFEHYATGNDLDAARDKGSNHTLALQARVDFFSRERIDSLPVSTNRSELPVFIIGMPRTGTSLVEQILASHSAVAAGGEREDVTAMLASLRALCPSDATHSQIMANFSTESMDGVANRHLENISSMHPGKTRFTDKTPLNGLHLELLSRLFPKCRIILCQRNALDTCLSIYFHRFNNLHGYARRLDTLGAFFRDYYALMAHWTSVLDINIMPIQYELLVSNPEEHIRTLIEFCGLDWEEDCLSFHENRRTINTPSYDQVRKPMYTNSVDRWKHYEQFLGGLKAAVKC
jgi:tetratricopeptide (TPR) repeat protein